MNPTVDVSIHNLPTDLSVPITITIGSLKEAEQQERSPPTLLSLLGKSIAAFFDSEDGKSLDANLGIEAHRSNPLLQQFTRLGIEHAIEEVAADCAPTLAKELIAKLLQNLHIVQEPPNQTPEPKPVNPEHSIPTKHQDNQDEIKQTVTKQPPATNADMSVAAAEVAASITGFVDDSLGSFYSPDDERVQSVVSKATPRVHELAAKFHISQELVSYLLLLGLYDITVLFDDSGSMQSENRIPAVKQLMSNLLQISTAVQDEHGIKIYPFGEYDLIGGKESITSEQDLQAKLNQVPFATGLGVQGPLKEKILDPLAAKALHKEIHNPVLIIIVTDGGDTTESATQLGNFVQSFRDEFATNGYKGAAVRMALFRVGTDSAAATYFDTIAATEGIGKTLLVYKENIADSLTNDGDHFMGQLIEILAEAISLDSSSD